MNWKGRADGERNTPVFVLRILEWSAGGASTISAQAASLGNKPFSTTSRTPAGVIRLAVSLRDNTWHCRSYGDPKRLQPSGMNAKKGTTPPGFGYKYCNVNTQALQPGLKIVVAPPALRPALKQTVVLERS